MTWWRRLISRRRLETDLDRELRDHLERQVADFVRDGMTESEARRRAALMFGGIEGIKESCRDARGTRWLTDLADDVRYSMRVFAHNPGFVAVAVLSLALGIGANTAIFSIVNSLLLRSLPVRDPGQLAILIHGSWTNPIWEQVRERQSLFDGAAGLLVGRVRSRRRRSRRSGRGALDQRQLLRRHGRAGARWTHLRRRGRPEVRRTERRRGRPRLFVLAASIRRRARRHRSLDHAQPRPVHDRRRDPARLSWPHRRSSFRRRGPDCHRAADARQGELARPPLDLVAGHHGPPKARTEPGRRHRRAASGAAADQERHGSARLAESRSGGLPEGALRPRAGRRRVFRLSRAVSRAAHRHHDHGRAGAAHRLRQHREPDARPGERATP